MQDELFEDKEAEEMLTYLEKEIRRYKQEGREEGLEEGLEEGIQKTARRMLASGMAISLVVEITELSEETVRQLAEEASN